jgi:hypothetical protein
MKIGFFEEFPDSISLKKLDLIDFPFTLILADYSIEGFKAIKERISKKDVKFIYWPLLNHKEGYWFSRFSKRRALLRSMDELLNIKQEVLIDLELPVLEPWLMFTQFFKSFKNKKYLKLFIEKRKPYTAEYFYEKPFARWLSLQFKGDHKVIKMMYSSMMGVTKYAKGKRIKFLHKQLGSRLCLGLGVLGKGITGVEPELSLEKLRDDLELCKRFNVKEVFIFRLGGLTKAHVKIIKEFI